MSTNQVKYYELLARYYVLKRQHMLAAHALLRLAERRSVDGVPTLEQRLIEFFLSLSLLSFLSFPLKLLSSFALYCCNPG